jgi:hypothetical protein
VAEVDPVSDRDPRERLQIVGSRPERPTRSARRRRSLGIGARWRRTNGPGKRQVVLAGVWTVLGIVIMATGLRDSVAVLSAVTLYTVVVGHWGAFQAATPTEE